MGRRGWRKYYFIVRSLRPHLPADILYIAGVCRPVHEILLDGRLGINRCFLSPLEIDVTLFRIFFLMLRTSLPLEFAPHPPTHLPLALTILAGDIFLL